MLLKRRAMDDAERPLTETSIWRQLPIIERGQVIRAIAVGLLFSAIFLWALPQFRPLAEVAPNPPADETVADAS